MAIAGDRIRFKFQDPREQPNKLAERFYGRVAFPDVRNPQQKALEYNRNMEQDQARTTNDIYNKEIYADIQRRLKNALEQKERFIEEIKYAPNMEQIEFYKRQIAILDKLINDLNLDLQRSALSAEYLKIVQDNPTEEIADTRKLEIVRDILKKPPAVAPELANKLKTALTRIQNPFIEPDIKQDIQKIRDTRRKKEAQQTIAGAMRQRLARNEGLRNLKEEYLADERRKEEQKAQEQKAQSSIAGAMRQRLARKDVEGKMIERLPQELERTRQQQQKENVKSFMTQFAGAEEMRPGQLEQTAREIVEQKAKPAVKVGGSRKKSKKQQKKKK